MIEVCQQLNPQFTVQEVTLHQLLATLRYHSLGSRNFVQLGEYSALEMHTHELIGHNPGVGQFK